MSLQLSGTNGVLDNSGAFIAGTAAATTSGTSVGFTSIPSWVKRVTFVLNGVGTNGTAGYLIQIGNGSFTSTGYVGGGTRIGGGSGNPTSSTAGFLINTAASGGAKNGIFTINLMGSNMYVCAGTGFSASEPNAYITGGAVTLSGAMDRIQITTTNGTDTFNAGSINILYE